MPNLFASDSLIGPLAGMLGLPEVVVSLLIILMTLWTLYWKAGALWEAARLRQKIWFVVLLVVNTVGILEIVYLIWYRKESTGYSVKSLFPFPKLAVFKETQASKKK